MHNAHHALGNAHRALGNAHHAPLALGKTPPHALYKMFQVQMHLLHYALIFQTYFKHELYKFPYGICYYICYKGHCEQGQKVLYVFHSDRKRKKNVKEKSHTVYLLLC